MINPTEVPIEIDFQLYDRATKDLKQAAEQLVPSQARYLVDFYYTVQAYRLRAGGQIRSSAEIGEPVALVDWMGDQMLKLESVIRSVMNTYSDTREVSRWAKSLKGIGPVLASGLIAHIDIEKAQTAGHIWRFAGLDPNVEWLGSERAIKLVNEVIPKDVKKVDYEYIVVISEMLQRRPENILNLAMDSDGVVTRTSLTKALAKRPWNSKLKVIAWKCGESFVKVQNNKDDYYGKIYVERKAREERMNLEGAYAKQAAETLERKRFDKGTDAYKAYSKGILPPAHIHARAKRYAVKIFLAHFFDVYYVEHHKAEPPKPYIITHGAHTHFIQPPDPDGIYGNLRREAGLPALRSI